MLTSSCAPSAARQVGVRARRRATRLPPVIVRIRRYGLLSNHVRVSLLARARELLGADPPLLLAPPGESRVAACQRIFKVDLDLCPKCLKGKLLVRASWDATRARLECLLAGLNPRAP